jgi:hypothetical protein
MCGRNDVMSDVFKGGNLSENATSSPLHCNNRDPLPRIRSIYRSLVFFTILISSDIQSLIIDQFNQLRVDFKLGCKITCTNTVLNIHRLRVYLQIVNSQAEIYSSEKIGLNRDIKQSILFSFAIYIL